MVIAGGDVRMAAREHVRIYPNRKRRPRAARPHMARRFAEQHFELRARFDVERQNPAARSRIEQRLVEITNVWGWIHPRQAGSIKPVRPMPTGHFDDMEIGIWPVARVH